MKVTITDKQTGEEQRLLAVNGQGVIIKIDNPVFPVCQDDYYINVQLHHQDKESALQSIIQLAKHRMITLESKELIDFDKVLKNDVFVGAMYSFLLSHSIVTINDFFVYSIQYLAKNNIDLQDRITALQSQVNVLRLEQEQEQEMRKLKR